MKKLNMLRTSFVAALMVCLMAVAFICTGVKAEAATTALHVTAGKLTAEPDTGAVAIYVNKDTVVDSYTVKAGVYYFLNGEAKDSATPVVNIEYYSSIGTNVNPISTVKAVSAGKITVSGTTITSTYKLLTGVYNNTVYYNGAIYTGKYYYKDATLYNVANGVIGTTVNGLAKGYYFDAATNTNRSLHVNGFYAKNGKATTGLVGLYYYTNGLTTNTKNGWKKISGNIYYFKSGKALTGGYHYLDSYGKGVKKYNYRFNSKGVLYTDLISYIGYNKFIQKDICIKSNVKTHNTTFYIKDSKGNFTIPCKTVVCATAIKKGDTPVGIYRLEKTWNKRWFVYTKTNGAPYRYYQWAVHIKGTPSLYHSSTYRRKSAASLRVDLYNKLGTSCTTHCIRHQAKWAKLIYDIATKTNKKRRVPVWILKSTNEGPFGHVSLQKIKSGTKWDPTDPNKK